MNKKQMNQKKETTQYKGLKMEKPLNEKAEEVSWVNEGEQLSLFHNNAVQFEHEGRDNA